VSNCCAAGEERASEIHRYHLVPGARVKFVGQTSAVDARGGDHPSERAQAFHCCIDRGSHLSGVPYVTRQRFDPGSGTGKLIGGFPYPLGVAVEERYGAAALYGHTGDLKADAMCRSSHYQYPRIQTVPRLLGSRINSWSDDLHVC
jgi:hypothetical protein